MKMTSSNSISHDIEKDTLIVTGSRIIEWEKFITASLKAEDKVRKDEQSDDTLNQ